MIGVLLLAGGTTGAYPMAPGTRAKNGTGCSFRDRPTTEPNNSIAGLADGLSFVLLGL